MDNVFGAVEEHSESIFVSDSNGNLYHQSCAVDRGAPVRSNELQVNVQDDDLYCKECVGKIECMNA